MNIDMAEDPGVRFPPPLIFLSFILAGAAIDIVAALPFPPVSDGLRWAAAAAVAIAGFSLVCTALRLFREAGTRPEPWRPSSALTTRGIYRVTRNPMYLGMAMLHVAISIAIGSLAALLLLAPVLVIIDRAVIRREEDYLSRRFGQPYLDYKARVRRWL
jgi:protein-S-isoprenylcysteine O-methyltransferase Ste14